MTRNLSSKFSRFALSLGFIGVLIFMAVIVRDVANPSIKAAAAQDQINLSGNWKLSFVDAKGVQQQALLQIHQRDLDLSGTLQGQRGSMPVTGTVLGNQIILSAKTHGRRVALSGTVEGETMTGTSENGSAWNARRE